MNRERMIVVLRDLLEEIDAAPDEQESTPEERTALLAGFEELIARHAHAANVRKVNALTPITRRTPIDPHLTPFEGATFEILNVTPDTFQYFPDATRQIELCPGPVFVSGEDPTAALQTHVEAGLLEVRPIDLRSTDWETRLIALALQRRVMVALRVKDLEAARALMPHVPNTFRQNALERITALEADPPPRAPQPYAKRLRTVAEAKPERAAEAKQ